MDNQSGLVEPKVKDLMVSGRLTDCRGVCPKIPTIKIEGSTLLIETDVGSRASKEACRIFNPPREEGREADQHYVNTRVI